MSTAKEVLESGVRELSDAALLEAKLDAWYLFSHVTKMSRVDFMLHGEKEIAAEQETKFNQMISKRSTHYPLQYMIGSQEFMGLNFLVDENVLIPRQDTEVLVEEVLNDIKISEETGKRVLDMCTGSGCIAISLCKLAHLKEVTGVDISDGALSIAKQNNERNETSVSFVKSNLFENISDKYDIIVSNPPYIQTKVIDTLMPEVCVHEPMLALDGKEDGLYFYREIIKNARNFLTDQGRIYFEIGYNQGEDVKNLLMEAGFNNVLVIQDLAGLDRVVKGCLE